MAVESGCSRGRSSRAHCSVDVPMLFQRLFIQAQKAAAISNPDILLKLDYEIDVTQKSCTDDTQTFKELSPETPFLADCLGALIGLLGCKHIPDRTICKVLSLLQGMASREHFKNLITKQLNLLSMLNVVLQRNKDEKPLLFECLTLLQGVTYGISIACPNGYVEDILKFVMGIVQNEPFAAGVSLCSLEVISNLCWKNESVKTFLKSMPSNRTFQRKLLSNLSTSSSSVLIVSLHIIGLLYLYDDLGEKIFSTENMGQTFQLTFGVLYGSRKHPASLHHAVDLFVDILPCERVQLALQRYTDLDVSLTKTVKLLCKSDEKYVAKICELCLAFSEVPHVRTRFLEKIINLSFEVKVEDRGTNLEGSPFSALISWLTPCTCTSAQLFALDLLKVIFEEVLNLKDSVWSCSHYADVLLHSLAPLLFVPVYSCGDESIKSHLKRVYKALSVISVLWSVDPYSSQCMKYISYDNVIGLIEDQIQNNPISNGLGQLKKCWSSIGADVVFLAFDLCLQNPKYGISAKKVLQHHAEDQRIFYMVAHGILYGTQHQVLVSLQLIQLQSSDDNLKLMSLADAIASTNRKKEVVEIPTHQKVSNPMDLSKGTVHSKVTSVRSVSLSAGMDALIEKFRTGVQLKDLKSSEIIDMYEHKVQALESKESNLQDLIDAKAIALSQADRLIAEYRLRMSQTDEECMKLRRLLKSAETRTENIHAKNMKLRDAEQDLLKEMKAIKSRTLLLQQDTEDNEQVIAVLGEQKKQMTSQIHHLEQKCLKSSAQLATFELEMQDQQRRLDELHTKYQLAERLNDVMKKSLDELNSVVQEREVLIKRLTEENSRHLKDLHSSQKELSEARNHIVSLEENNAILQEEVTLFSAVKSLINTKDIHKST